MPYIPIGISIISVIIAGVSIYLGRSDKHAKKIQDIDDNINEINIRLSVIEEQIKHSIIAQNQMSEIRDLMKDIKRTIK